MDVLNAPSCFAWLLPRRNIETTNETPQFEFLTSLMDMPQLYSNIQWCNTIMYWQVTTGHLSQHCQINVLFQKSKKFTIFYLWQKPQRKKKEGVHDTIRPGWVQQWSTRLAVCIALAHPFHFQASSMAANANTTCHLDINCLEIIWQLDQNGMNYLLAFCNWCLNN